MTTLTEEQEKNPLMVKARAARRRLALAQIDSAFCDVAFDVGQMGKALELGFDDRRSVLESLQEAVTALGEAIEKARML